MGLKTCQFEVHSSSNHKIVAAMTTYSKQYGECITEEEGKTAEEVLVANVGKIDPKRHLEAGIEELMSQNIVQLLGAMLATIVF